MKKIWKRVIGMMLVVVMLVPMIQMQSFAVNRTPKTSALDFLYSIRYDNATAYTRGAVRGYRYSGGRTYTRNIAAYTEVKITNVSKDSGGKVQVKPKGVSQKYWIPANKLLRNPNFQIYGYQPMKTLQCYSSVSSSSKRHVYDLNYRENKVGTSEGEVTIIGASDRFVQAYCGNRIFYLKKSELFTHPISSGSKYSILSNARRQSAKDGLYFYFMAVKGNAAQSEANIQLKRISINPYSRKNTLQSDKYKYQFVYNSSTGFYTIQNAWSGKRLDVQGGSTDCGANLWQYEPNGTMAQNFQIFYFDKHYYIRSQLGNYVDVSGGAVGDNVNIWAYEGNRTQAQQWSFDNIY